jgi:peptidylprolyl isomerase
MWTYKLFLFVMQKLNLKTSIGIVSGLAVVALFFWYGLPGAELPEQNEPEMNTAAQQEVAAIRSAFESLSPEESDFVALPGGVLMFELISGDGPEVGKDKSIAIHYTARFESGIQFDSSIERNQPLLFVYGQNQLIPGVEAGLAGAHTGSVRRIIVPPELGYGEDGVVLEDGTVVIPPNAVLIFDVSVVNVEE